MGNTGAWMPWGGRLGCWRMAYPASHGTMYVNLVWLYASPILPSGYNISWKNSRALTSSALCLEGSLTVGCAGVRFFGANPTGYG